MNSYLDNYSRKCKNTIGGIKRVFLLRYTYYDESKILTNNGNLIIFPGSIVYKFEAEGNYNQGTSTESGVINWGQNIDIKLPKLYGEMNPNIFTETKFRVIVETNNGIYLMFGLLGGLNCSITNASGSNKNDFNGFNLTFEGTEEESAVITDIDSYYIFNNDEYFNYDFNFNL